MPERDQWDDMAAEVLPCSDTHRNRSCGQDDCEHTVYVSAIRPAVAARLREFGEKLAQSAANEAALREALSACGPSVPDGGHDGRHRWCHAVGEPGIVWCADCGVHQGTDGQRECSGGASLVAYAALSRPPSEAAAAVAKAVEALDEAEDVIAEFAPGHTVLLAKIQEALAGIGGTR